MSVDIPVAISGLCAACNLAFVCYAFARAPKLFADRPRGAEQVAELRDRITDLGLSSGGTWQLAKMNRPLPDDPEPEHGSGSGEPGWCIYLEEVPEEGPFAWLPARPDAEAVIDMHNELLDGIDELLMLVLDPSAESDRADGDESAASVGRGR